MQTYSHHFNKCCNKKDCVYFNLGNAYYHCDYFSKTNHLKTTLPEYKRTKDNGCTLYCVEPQKPIRTFFIFDNKTVQAERHIDRSNARSELSEYIK